MAAPVFPIFQQARMQYRASAPLHNFTADLGQLLEADSRISQLEQNLTDRQKDRRRFHKIETLKPKLDRRIEQLRTDIHDEQQKIKKVQQEVNQVEWWNNKFQSMTGQTGGLVEAEKAVQQIKDDFIHRFKLPIEIFDKTWIEEYKKFIADPTHKPSTPDFFETIDSSILDIFANSYDIVQPHPSGRGFTITSIVEFLQAAKANLDDLSAQYEETNRQHEEDINALWAEHETEVDNLNDELKREKESAEQWEEIASKHVLAHAECEKVLEERDYLKEKEEEFEGALAQVEELKTELKTVREEKDEAVQQLRVEEEARRAAETELTQFKSNRTPLESDIEGLNEQMEEERAKLEEEKVNRGKIEEQLADATKQVAIIDQNNQDLLALSKQLVHCYVHNPRHPDNPLPMDISLFLPLITDPDFDLATDIVKRTMPPISLVAIYADADLTTDFNLYTLVAESLGLPIDYSRMDLLDRAIVLERSILPELTKGNHSAKAASLVYRHAGQLATVNDLRSDAFLSLCSSFETINQWFPHTDPAQYIALMESILVQRYSRLPTGVLPSLLDQVCIYHLGMTLPSRSAIFEQYSVDVCEALTNRTVNIGHSIPAIADLAFGQSGVGVDARGGGVVRYTSGAVEFILIRTAVDVRHGFDEYMFWRMDYEEEMWTMSTAGMDIIIDGPGENAKWICTPRNQCKRWDVQFEFMEHDASVGADLQSFLRMFHPEEVQAAFTRNAEQQAEAAMLTLDDDEVLSGGEMDVDG